MPIGSTGCETTVRSASFILTLSLARQMGVTDKAVSNWERDLSIPDVSSLPRLAGLLGVSVEELLQAKDVAREGGRGRRPQGA